MPRQASSMCWLLHYQPNLPHIQALFSPPSPPLPTNPVTNPYEDGQAPTAAYQLILPVQYFDGQEFGRIYSAVDHKL
ncbi:hypothetical protein K443DRAFT_12899 [Laccaria amethystina LaAM-08-1]|uniref:Uncharacterized protein n=1 Tax=Laccaria amethystina LaAM-08-1 TaxID=1095629 RepID=A0A0C9X710_9AGAR|nr:hypothetical protein K443DRAFT_12899 [Laccaria amethystina LaAM-08-1]